MKIATCFRQGTNMSQTLTGKDTGLPGEFEKPVKQTGANIELTMP